MTYWISLFSRRRRRAKGPRSSESLLKSTRCITRNEPNASEEEGRTASGDGEIHSGRKLQGRGEFRLLGPPRSEKRAPKQGFQWFGHGARRGNARARACANANGWSERPAIGKNAISSKERAGKPLEGQGKDQQNPSRHPEVAYRGRNRGNSQAGEIILESRGGSPLPAQRRQGGKRSGAHGENARAAVVNPGPQTI